MHNFVQKQHKAVKEEMNKKLFYRDFYTAMIAHMLYYLLR